MSFGPSLVVNINVTLLIITDTVDLANPKSFPVLRIRSSSAK